MKKKFIATILITALIATGTAFAIINFTEDKTKNDSTKKSSATEDPVITAAAAEPAATEEPATTEELKTTEESSASEESASTMQSTTEATDLTFEINMNFVGDIMLAGNETGTSRIDDYAANQPEGYFFEGVNDMFKNDDFTIANCENVFTDNDNLIMREKGQTAAEKEYQKALAKYEKAIEKAELEGTSVDIEKPVNDFIAFWFRCRSENAKLMRANGIDIVSLDNNHTHDFGDEGFEDTKAAMDAADLAWGDAGKIVYKEKNGFRIAFVIGSMFDANCDYLMLSDLETAKENSDYQVVFFHGGTERLHAPEQWKIDSCHRFVDAGADLVVGCHPHVLQPMETYNGVNIVYSLGNFIFGGNNYPENATAIYNHKITVTCDRTKNNFTVTDNSNYAIIPCFVYTGEINNFQPAIVDDYEEEKQIILDFMNWKRETPF